MSRASILPTMFVLLLLMLAGCAATRPSGGRLQVVAAENFWGSIARQLGGPRVDVRSILTDPNADPHEYTSNPGDARAVADADEAIINGAGYDGWAQKLLGAGSSNPHRHALRISALAGPLPGGNPHLWYSPSIVERAIAAISSDLARLDPAHASEFAARRAQLESALGPYHATIAAIRARFAGTSVAATETIFVPLAAALGLRLVSPPSFMQAVAEGNDPPAQSVIDFEQQLSSRTVRILVYNVQTATAVTSRIKAEATAAGIPVVGISESLTPPGASFQDWQLTQLKSIASALNGR